MNRKLSKVKLKKRLSRKTNYELAETISAAKNLHEWSHIAKIISSSTRKQSAINLFEINAHTKEGDTVVIPGKVLSKGELTKKIRLCALGISEVAREKLKKTKTEYATILEEIKKNPRAEGIKVIK